MGLTANKPSYKIEVNGKDVTANIQDNLISIVLVDNATGDEADTLNIAVYRKKGKKRVALPKRGAVLKVWLGYEETSLMYMGQYVMGKRNVNPYIMTLIAQSTPVNSSKAFGQLNTQRTRSLPDGVTIGSLCQLVASTHKLSNKVASTLAGTPLGVVYQRNESDLHLLTRLSKDFHFSFKIANGTLIVYPADDATAGGTQAVPTLTVTEADLKDWDWDDDGKTEGGTVIAKYRTPTKQSVEVSAGQGEPIRRLKRVYPSQLQATTAANAHLTSNKKQQTNLQLTFIGNPTLIAEAKITLKGLDEPELNRTYTAQKVTHTIDNAGFVTLVEAY